MRLDKNEMIKNRKAVHW